MPAAAPFGGDYFFLDPTALLGLSHHTPRRLPQGENPDASSSPRNRENCILDSRPHDAAGSGLGRARRRRPKRGIIRGRGGGRGGLLSLAQYPARARAFEPSSAGIFQGIAGLPDLAARGDACRLEEMVS